MSIFIRERSIVAARGPYWWLAWMQERPDLAYKGRSSSEAVGRLVLDLSEEFSGLPAIKGASGYPLLAYADPLTAEQLAAHRAELIDWRQHHSYDALRGKRTA